MLVVELTDGQIKLFNCSPASLSSIVSRERVVRFAEISLDDVKVLVMNHLINTNQWSKAVVPKQSFKKGFYETVYGNVAFVQSAKAKSAYDVDAGERIPISQVDLGKFIRIGKNRYE